MAQEKIDNNQKKGWGQMFQNSQELTFLMAGVLMFIIVVWYLVNNISFLVRDFNEAFNVKVESDGNSSSFNLEGAKRITNEKR